MNCFIRGTRGRIEVSASNEYHRPGEVTIHIDMLEQCTDTEGRFAASAAYFTPEQAEGIIHKLKAAIAKARECAIKRCRCCGQVLP